MQERAIFLFVVVPLCAGTLAATLREGRLRKRVAVFVVFAIVTAAMAIASPRDPKLPWPMHLPLTLFAFVVPSVMTAIALTVRVRVLGIDRAQDSPIGSFVIGWIEFVVFLFASLSIAAASRRLNLGLILFR